MSNKYKGNDLKRKIKADDRFYINDISLNYIFRRNVVGYKLIEIPVGKIRRYYDKKVFSLYKTDPYRYLNDPFDSKTSLEYEKYCVNNCEDNPERSIDTFHKLSSDFTTNRYDITKGIIVVDQYNFIMDGQHRACILLKQYGEYYRIQVLKIRLADYGVKTPILNTIYNVKRILRIDC